MPGKNYSKGGGKYRKKTMSQKEVEKLVDKKIQQKSETKQATSISGGGDDPLSYGGFPILHNSSIRQADCIRLIGAMGQGTAEGQRIGNEVMLQSLNVRGWIQQQYSPAANRSRLGVRLFAFSVKGFDNGGHAISNFNKWGKAFLRAGDKVKAFDGLVADWLLPVNRDIITLHAERRIYLNQPRSYQIGPGIPDTEQIPVQQEYSTKMFNINVKCKNKVLKFSKEYDTDATAAKDIPQNYGPLIALGYCHLDGSLPDQADTAVSMSFVSTIKYEDK